VVSIYSALLVDRNFFRNSHEMQMTLGWLMMGSMAASAAGSFRRERESGVLELMLVTPLSTRQIIGGRLRGLWGQFLPAVSLLLGIWVYFDRLLLQTDATEMPLVFAGLFVSVPVVGLYFSLRCRHFIAAFLLTLAGSFIPGWMFLWGLVTFGPAFGFAPEVTSLGMLLLLAALQAGLVAMCLFGLKRRLEQRLFSFERTAV
jgi:ABC-type Na+ efflux pump permease subunit